MHRVSLEKLRLLQSESAVMNSRACSTDHSSYLTVERSKLLFLFVTIEGVSSNVKRKMLFHFTL